MDPGECWQLLSAVLVYFEQVSATYRSAIAEDGRQEAWLPFAIEDTEDSPEFHRLVTRVSCITGIRHASAQRKIKTFMRRCGAYLGPVDLDTISRRLVELTTGKGTISITNLMSLPWVSEDVPLPVEGEGFQLVRLDPAQLANHMENGIRRLFYPSGAISDLESSVRSHGAWLLVDEEEELTEPDVFVVDFSILGGRPNYTRFSRACEMVLGPLMLLDWHLARNDRAARTAWFQGHPIGFFTRIDDNWFSDVVGTRRDHLIAEDGYPDAFPVKFTCSDVEKLAELHRKITKLADAGVTFLVDRALRFFLRSCIVDSYADLPERVDQIIYLCATLDALAGGNTNKMARRISYITGYPREQVHSVYDYRSDLVHGREVDEVPVEVSWIGFEIARKALRAAIDLAYECVIGGAPVERRAFLRDLDRAMRA